MLAICLAPGAAMATTTAESVTTTTPMWRAYAIRTDGSGFAQRVAIRPRSGPVYVGGIAYGDDGRFIGGWTYTAFLYQNSYQYQLNVLPGTPVEGGEVREIYSYDTSVEIGWNLPGGGDSGHSPKTYRLLLWSAGDTGAGTTHELKAASPAGIDLVRTPAGDPVMTSGSEAYVDQYRDFAAPAVKAGAQASAPPEPGVISYGMGPGARAIVQGQLSIPVKHAFVGQYIPLVGPVDRPDDNPWGRQINAMGVTAQNGLRSDCMLGCRFWEITSPLSLGAGTYTFDLTGAGAGVGPFGDVLLGGVDAYLPWAAG